MIPTPVFKIDQIVWFTEGTTYGSEHVSLPAMIKIKSAVYVNSSWHYSPNEDVDKIIYKEEFGTLLP